MPNLYPFHTFPAKIIGSALDKLSGLDQEYITSAEGGIMSTPIKVFNVTTTDANPPPHILFIINKAP